METLQIFYQDMFETTQRDRSEHVSRWRQIVYRSVPIQILLMTLLAASALVPIMDDEDFACVWSALESAMDLRLQWPNGQAPF